MNDTSLVAFLLYDSMKYTEGYVGIILENKFIMARRQKIATFANYIVFYITELHPHSGNVSFM
jgi:hypothetical protein